MAVDILYLHFRPGLGLSALTFVLMCCITEQKTIRIENSRANAQINGKSINFKRGEINCANSTRLMVITKKFHPGELGSPLRTMHSDTGQTQKAGGVGADARHHSQNH